MENLNSQNLDSETCNKIQRLQEIYDNAQNIVFFGGAGVSTESGVPDFRSKDGIYSQTQWKYPPEVMVSRTFFDSDIVEFYRFYRAKLIKRSVQPNAAHNALAQMEQAGKLKAIVTQNIDGLHQKAGSKNIFELHGSALRNYCMECGEFYDDEFIADENMLIPQCQKCGGVVKPDVVLYEEPLNYDVMQGAIKAIRAADTLIVGGTSLVVYPAAGMIDYFNGKNLVLINKEATTRDSQASLVIHAKIGEVLGSLRI